MTETPNPDAGWSASQPEPPMPPAAPSDPTAIVARPGSPADDQKTQQISPLPGPGSGGWSAPVPPPAPGGAYGYPGAAVPTGAYPGNPADPAAATQAHPGAGGMLPPPPQHPSGPTGDAEGTKKSAGKAKKLVFAGLGVLVIAAAAVAVLGFWKPGFFWTHTLDVNAVQTGVQLVLTDPVTGYGAANVTDVRCNDGQNPVIASGATFGCGMKIGGIDRTVTVTFIDSTGTYGVGAPQ